MNERTFAEYGQARDSAAIDHQVLSGVLGCWGKHPLVMTPSVSRGTHDRTPGTLWPREISEAALMRNGTSISEAAVTLILVKGFRQVGLTAR